jgi:hypothetical protein
LLEHLEAVQSRQHHVEENHVVVRSGPLLDGLFAGAGLVDHVALMGQATIERPGQLGIVLHEQHSHASSVTGKSSPPWLDSEENRSHPHDVSKGFLRGF